ncbi:complement factor H-related protein 1-like isoform X2 [Paralichthys olivaceus]|uniref:complement factor H-related protein 1-like isoform X2 n=1 Tax=Paralichthys olivaceus TaxID=8255 RepID=UPI003751EB18
MCSRYVGFILLVWFPGALHAQSAARHCPAPALVGGYFVPVKETYSHDFQLTYACENTYKPAVEGWWATSVCQDGTWSHTPQCIDEKGCFPPTIANGKYTHASDGWYEEESVIRITCDKGYEHKNNLATAKCANGTWSSLPTCEQSIKTCSMPPKVPHAVIVHQGYLELFPEDSKVHYECKDGYRMEGSDKNPIVCLAGTWTEYPTCSKVTVRGDHTSTERGTQPGSGGGGGRGHSTSSGPGTQPGSGGYPSTSDTRPIMIPIKDCGTWPLVPNGVVVVQDRMFLKFTCNAFYTQVGPEDVVCYNDGSWSQIPICKDAFCVMVPGYYTYGLRLSENQFIKEGELTYIPCEWNDYSVAVRCTDRRITHTSCCRSYDHQWKRCSIVRENFLPVGSLIKK